MPHVLGLDVTLPRPKIRPTITTELQLRNRRRGKAIARRFATEPESSSSVDLIAQPTCSSTVSATGRGFMERGCLKASTAERMVGIE